MHSEAKQSQKHQKIQSGNAEGLKQGPVIPYTRKFLVSTLRLFDLMPRKGLSQYYLYGKKINEKIVNTCRLTSETNVLEIGPGAGHITHRLGRRAGQVYCIEKDERLRGWHEYFFKGRENIHFIYEDFLKFDIQQFCGSRESSPLVIVGNIPYQITSPLIFRVFDSEVRFQRMVLVMQHEVAVRIVSPPGNRAYSFLSVKAQFYSKPELALSIPPEEFFPAPKINSAVVVFEPRGSLPIGDPEERRLFFKFVDAAFRQRRKMLINSLANNWDRVKDKEIIRSALIEMGLDERIRAEYLSIDQFIGLFNKLRGSKLKIDEE